MPPAAKQGDKVVALDIHFNVVQGVPMPVSYAFNGTINGSLSSNVSIQGQAAATVDSTATNMPAHMPMIGPFTKTPSNKGTIQSGSTSVFINSKAAARAGDPVITCNDPVDRAAGSVIAVSTVIIGG